MDTKLLKSFLHVAELESLSRAATRLHITQPALSRQIRQLEELMTVDLFDRTGRGMTLTEAGQRLAARARPLLAELEALPTLVAERDEDVTGSVHLAVPPSLSTGLTADVIEAYRHAYPQVDVRMVVALSGAVLAGLLRGDLDMGVIYQSVGSAHLHTEPLYREHLWLIGAPSTGLSDTQSVSFSQAMKHPLVLPAPRHGLRVLIEAEASRRGHHVQVVVEADSLRLLVELVSRGVGYGLLPIRTVEADLAKTRVVAAPIHRPRLQRSALLAWPLDRPLTPAGEAMHQILRQHTRNLNPGALAQT